MNKEKLVSYIIKTAKNKELLNESLDLLKDAGIDYLSIENKDLNEIVFHHLLKNPNEIEKKLLSEIWNYNDGKYRKNLSFLCESSTFGRQLLKEANSSEDAFISFYNNGSLKELKDFMAKSPDFFKTFNSYDKLYNATLSKVIFCQGVGFKVDNRVLHQVVESEELLMKPEKLLKLIVDNERNVTAKHWDGLLIKLIKNSSQNNFDWNVPTNYKVNDALYLFSLIKEPENHLLSDLISQSFLSVPGTGGFFHSEHRNMPEEKFIKKYVQPLKSFNQKGMLTRDVFDKCKEYFGKSYLGECISLSLSDMISTPPVIESFCPAPKDYLKEEGINLKLYTRNEYREKLRDTHFCKELIAQTYQITDRQIFTQVINIINKESIFFRGETSPIYDFFNEQLNESETKNKFLKQIKNKDFGTEFHHLLTVIRLEMSLSDKPNDKKKIKI